MRTFLIILAACLPAIASTETLMGRADHVRDGDTVVVSGVPIRLQGLAAQELREKWGKASRNAMQRIVAGQRLRCELTVERSHDRKIERCYLDDGSDTAAVLVSQGLGQDCPRFSGGRYADDETGRSRTLPFPGYYRPR